MLFQFSYKYTTAYSYCDKLCKYCQIQLDKTKACQVSRDHGHITYVFIEYN